MKSIKNIFVLLFVIGLVACDDLTDSNIDPNNLPEAETSLNLILPAAQAQTMYNVGALAGRMPGILTQHFFGFDAQQVPYSTYSINESDLNNLWNFGLYVGSMKDCIVIIEKAQAEEQPQYEGIAKILLAQNLGLATQFWGDIPYSEAFDGVTFPSPAFDSQESIYTSIQGLLDEAITLMQQPIPGSGFVGGDDLFFAGDVDSWVSTARALKARYWMQLTEVNAAAAQNALDAITAGTIGSIEEEPLFAFDAAVTGANPYAQFGAQRPKTLIIAPEFQAMLNDNGDPREALYMEPDGDEFLFYAGQEGSNTVWSNNASPLPLISYTEVKFLEAEALVRTGSISAAETAFADAITASMDQLTVVADIIGVDGISTVDRDAYVAANGDFGGETNTEALLEIIHNESYRALFAQAEPEVWSNWRRTGYPTLVARAGGVNGNNPSGQIPVRFVYPIDERVTNSESMEAAITNQGGSLMDDNLWAFPN